MRSLIKGKTISPRTKKFNDPICCNGFDVEIPTDLKLSLKLLVVETLGIVLILKVSKIS